MSVLYYLGREDGSHEAFALNAYYRYAHWPDDGKDAFEALQDGVFRLEDHAKDPTEFAAKFIDPRWQEWGKRIGERLFAWAKSQPLRFLSENNVMEWQGTEDYDEHIRLITGSAHDSDYEEDGMTYKPGSGY